MALFEELGSMPRRIERASLITSGSSGGLNAGPLGAALPGCGVSTANEDVVKAGSNKAVARRIIEPFRHENITLHILDGAY